MSRLSPWCRVFSSLWPLNYRHHWRFLLNYKIVYAANHSALQLSAVIPLSERILCSAGREQNTEGLCWNGLNIALPRTFQTQYLPPQKEGNISRSYVSVFPQFPHGRCKFCPTGPLMPVKLCNSNSSLFLHWQRKPVLRSGWSKLMFSVIWYKIHSNCAEVTDSSVIQILKRVLRKAKYDNDDLDWIKNCENARYLAFYLIKFIDLKKKNANYEHDAWKCGKVLFGISKQVNTVKTEGHPWQQGRTKITNTLQHKRRASRWW